MRAYSGSLPFRDAPEAIADKRLQAIEGAPALSVGAFEGGSAYRRSFRQGATLVPRMLCLVERRQIGRLGVNPSAPFVASRRSSQEKRPWRDLLGIENPVEAEFLRPVLLGESILPYRVFRPFEGVVPVDEKGVVLDADAAANRGIDGLHGWMRKAEGAWSESKSSTMSLVQQFDYYGKLGSQFPIASLRMVYAKAGSQPAACLLRDKRAVIDHKLYWMTPVSETEARYLTAILNSEVARARAEQFQSRGQFGARDFDKVIFNLPIPRFDAREKLHLALAETAARAEQVAAAVELPEGVKFQRARSLVRAALTEAGLAQQIDGLVAQLIDGGSL